MPRDHDGLLILTTTKEKQNSQDQKMKRGRPESEATTTETKHRLRIPQNSPEVDELLRCIGELQATQPGARRPPAKGTTTERTTATTTMTTTTRKKTFKERITPEILKRIPGQIARITVQKNPRHRTVEHHVALFGGDALAAAAAMSMTLRPSTTRTYVATMRTLFPEQRAALTPFLRHSTRQMLTPAGAPQTANHFTPEALRNLLRRPGEQKTRNTVAVMFVTASRHADLKHFLVSRFPGAVCIDLVCVEDDGNFRAPKSDLFATKKLRKWITPHFALNFAGPWASYAETQVYLREIASTPHGVRGSAVEALQQRGFSSAEISCLTQHAPGGTNPGIANYLARVAVDPAAAMALRLSKELQQMIL